MNAYIRLIQVDSSDLAVGLKVGDELKAIAVTKGNGVVYYIVNAPKQKNYHIVSSQVEAA